MLRCSEASFKWELNKSSYDLRRPYYVEFCICWRCWPKIVKGYMEKASFLFLLVKNVSVPEVPSSALL